MVRDKKKTCKLNKILGHSIKLCSNTKIRIHLSKKCKIHLLIKLKEYVIILIVFQQYQVKLFLK